MEFKQIQELLKAVNKSNISEVTVKDGEFEITIKQNNVETQFVAMQPNLNPPQVLQQAVPQQQPAPVPAQAAASAPSAAAESSNTVIVKSPMIGTFYRSSGPDKPPFVNVGDDIQSGKVLCIIEAMKLFNEIESEVNGRIVKVLVDDATPVEYDQPLFLVEPS